MKSSASILLAVVLLGGLLRAQGVPPWARNLPDLPNQSGWYQGLGSAQGEDETGWQKASGQARAQILQQIRVAVVNTVAARAVETFSAAGSSVAQSFASTTDQLTEGTLEGVIVERWFDRDHRTLYAYASIEKAAVDRKFEEQLGSALASATVSYNAGVKAVAHGDVYLGLRDYQQAVTDVAFAEFYLKRTVTGDLRGGPGHAPVLPVLQSELCALMNRLQFQLTGGNDQAAERGRALPLVLSGRVLYRDAGSMVPLKNAALAASFVAPASGRLSAVTRTDEEGSFEFAATEVGSGESVNRIRVRVAVPGFEVLGEKLPDAARCLADSYGDFTFRLRTRANVTVAMHILEYNLDRKRPKSSVQEEIQKKLLGDRYTIVEESRMLKQVAEDKLNSAVRSGNFEPVVSRLAGTADVIVVGFVSTAERANPSSGIFFSSGTAVIRAIDAKTGRILASVSLDNEKEGGGSYEVAGVRLLQKMGKRIGDELKSSIDAAFR